MRARPGFTVIELVVVMTVVGALMLIAMPRIDLAAMRVRSAEQQVASTILAAQQRAVLQQHDVRVGFDTASSLIGVHDDQDNDGIVDAGEPVRTLALEEGVRFTAVGTPDAPVQAVTFPSGSEGYPVLTFRRGGFGSAAGRVYLGTRRSALTGAEAEVRRLEVERATGRVTRSLLSGGAWKTQP